MKPLFLWIFLSIVSCIAYGEDISGRVVGVTDGDTIKVLTADKTQIKVRLTEIDTPESGQPYGAKSKKALSDFVFGKTVVVRSEGTDRYGRTLGRVSVAGLDVNAEMVRIGAAWVYRQYNKDKSLLELEAEAKASKRGLWGLPEAERVPPWEWRRREIPSGSSSRVNPTNLASITTSEFECSAKHTCGQMLSCAEARFYLTQCGLHRLDGDKDGVPCESLCN